MRVIVEFDKVTHVTKDMFDAILHVWKEGLYKESEKAGQNVSNLVTGMTFRIVPDDEDAG